MNVLQKLHVYMAFKEGKMYITPAGAPAPGAKISGYYSKDNVTVMLARLDRNLSVNPNDAASLNSRCYIRGIAKINLDSAMADCEQAIKLKPNTAAILDSKAFIFYQQGKYADALSVYDEILKTDFKLSSSLYARGLTKGKLGDQPGKSADQAAAKALDPGIEAQFVEMGLSD